MQKFFTSSIPLTLLFGVLSSTPAYAQNTATAYINTDIGNPQATPNIPPECGNMAMGGGSSDLVQAGEKLMAAYVACLGGSTNAGANDCIRKNLQSSGFTEKQISAFETRRPGSIIGCTQCLGYVGLVTSLFNADPTSLTGFNGASDVLAVDIIKSGSNSYKKMPPGTPPQAGDIGISAMNTFGHALIVKQPMGNIKFTAVEANWRPCKATNDVEHNQATEKYTFYRKQ